MGLTDTYIVYRFVRLLTTPFDETDAFKLGVIDASGKLIVDTNRMNRAQQDAYSLFNRLVFNIKRLIEKIPGGKSKIGSYAAALYLFKEEMGDEEGKLVLERSFLSYLKEHNALDENYLTEQHKPSEILPQGNYKIQFEMLDVMGNSVERGSLAIAAGNLQPVRRILGVDLYELQLQNGNKVVASCEDLREI
jgi:hypothetical protein